MSLAARSFRVASRSRLSARSSVRSLATSVETSSATGTVPPPPVAHVEPKLNRIVDDISSLTLLQAADLVTLLKSRLNIQEIAMPSVSAAPAPAVSEAAEEAPAEKPKEKTIFSVNLVKINDSAKSKIIKEVKALVPNMTLIEAKKFVESLPKNLKDNVPKEDAEKIKKALEELGATVELA